MIKQLVPAPTPSEQYLIPLKLIKIGYANKVPSNADAATTAPSPHTGGKRDQGEEGKMDDLHSQTVLGHMDPNSPPPKQHVLLTSKKKKKLSAGSVVSH